MGQDLLEALKRIQASVRGRGDCESKLEEIDECCSLAIANAERTSEPDQTDLGASDDRPLGPDHPAYRSN